MRNETGIEELRVLVDNAGITQESALDDFDIFQVVRLLRACRALNLETYPDQLYPHERRYAARTGKISTKTLRRLYKENGEPETGSDWKGRK